jgi:hypothetical protein
MLNVPSFIMMVERNVRPHINRTPFGRLSIPPPPFFEKLIYLYIKYYYEKSYKIDRV